MFFKVIKVMPGYKEFRYLKNVLKIINVTVIWSSVGITTDNTWMYIALRFVFLS